MSDGISLEADLYLPDGDGPFPALVSAYPYHKDDLIGALFDQSQALLCRARFRGAHR